MGKRGTEWKEEESRCDPHREIGAESKKGATEIHLENCLYIFQALGDIQ
jgi:hypothetical protein